MSSSSSAGSSRTLPIYTTVLAWFLALALVVLFAWGALHGPSVAAAPAG